MAILHEGRINVSKRVDSLLRHEQSRVILQTGDTQGAREYCANLPGVRLLTEAPLDGNPNHRDQIYCELKEMSSAELNLALVNRGFDIFEIRQEHPSLDSLFHKITGAVRNG